MPIKLFSAPGDHRDDFREVEKQFNAWEQSESVRVTHLTASVVLMTGQRDVGPYPMTVDVHFEPAKSS